MSDVPETAAVPSPGRATTAGGLIRQARQAQGLHIAALAAAIKVLPRKLELLESDQFDQLPDATFTRALAHTVCRTLKIDPGPVLALLPPPKGHRLEQVSEGLNTPFRERPGRPAPKDWVNVASPTLWIVGLLVVASAAVYLLPATWLSFPKANTTRAPDTTASGTGAAAIGEASPTGAGQTPAPANSSIVEAPAAAAAPPVIESTPQPAAADVAPAATTAAPTPNAGVLQLRATAQSWIEVTDAHGKALIARLVQPGENVGLDGDAPFKVRIGNAGATQVVFRGRRIELAPSTRDNIARLELK
jgi:cytoskeleton protein RodZ